MTVKNFLHVSLLLLLAAVFFGFEIINVLVSLQYETDGPNECISTVTQTNLCDSLAHCKALSSGCLAAAGCFLAWSWVKQKNQC